MKLFQLCLLDKVIEANIRLRKPFDILLLFVIVNTKVCDCECESRKGFFLFV